MDKQVRYTNRRQFPRFKVDNGLFVIHSDFGKVQEVGIGGVVFHYIEKDHKQDGFPDRGVVFSQNDDYLVELPFNTISDTSIRNTSLSCYNLRKRVVAFGELSLEQLNQLETLILNNVVIPIQEEYLVTVMSDASSCRGNRPGAGAGESYFPPMYRWEDKGEFRSGFGSDAA